MLQGGWAGTQRTFAALAQGTQEGEHLQLSEPDPGVHCLLAGAGDPRVLSQCDPVANGFGKRRGILAASHSSCNRVAGLDMAARFFTSMF